MDIQEIRESLREFSGSELAAMTVRELLTSTTNVALPTMVVAQALLVLSNKLDMRPYAAVRQVVPKGAGKTVDIQIVTAPTYDDWSEGDALAAADPSLVKKTATIAPFGKVTKITDLLANTSAINFVETIGTIHGSAVQQGIFDKSIDALAGATDNYVDLGAKDDATEADISLDHISSAIGAITSDSYAADAYLTAADKFWTTITTDWDKKLFYGALADFVISGKAPKMLGLEVLMDPYHELAINEGSAWSGANAEKYAVVFTKAFSFGWAELEVGVESEVYRKGDELSNYIVSHLDGGATIGVDKAVSVIRHAT